MSSNENQQLAFLYNLKIILNKQQATEAVSSDISIAPRTSPKEKQTQENIRFFTTCKTKEYEFEQCLLNASIASHWLLILLIAQHSMLHAVKTVNYFPGYCCMEVTFHY